MRHILGTLVSYFWVFFNFLMVRCQYLQDSAWYSYKSATQNSIYIFKIYSVLRVGTLLRFPSLLRSNQVSGILERGGNLTDFSKTQYDRQSIWSNFKEIQNRNNFFSACQIISDGFQNRLKIFHEGKLEMFLGSAVKRVCSLVTLTNTEVEFWLQASSTDQWSIINVPTLPKI